MKFYSQAPDVPLKYPLYLKRTDFMKVLSLPQDHCDSDNNFIKKIRKIIKNNKKCVLSNSMLKKSVFFHNPSRSHIFVRAKKV